jgi:hypothetical protein
MYAPPADEMDEDPSEDDDELIEAYFEQALGEYCPAQWVSLVPWCLGGSSSLFTTKDLITH